MSRVLSQEIFNWKYFPPKNFAIFILNSVIVLAVVDIVKTWAKISYAPRSTTTVYSLLCHDRITQSTLYTHPQSLEWNQHCNYYMYIVSINTKNLLHKIDLILKHDYFCLCGFENISIYTSYATFMQLLKMGKFNFNFIRTKKLVKIVRSAFDMCKECCS